MYFWCYFNMLICIYQYNFYLIEFYDISNDFKYDIDWAGSNRWEEAKCLELLDTLEDMWIGVD